MIKKKNKSIMKIKIGVTKAKRTNVPKKKKDEKKKKKDHVHSYTESFVIPTMDGCDKTMYHDMIS